MTDGHIQRGIPGSLRGSVGSAAVGSRPAGVLRGGAEASREESGECADRGGECATEVTFGWPEKALSPNARGHWSGKEDEIVRSSWKDMSHRDIGIQLGRTEKAVRNYCYRLGLVDKSNQWSEEELGVLRAAYISATVGKEIGLDYLATRLGRHKSNVCRKARQLGLTDNSRDQLRAEQKRKKVVKFPTKELLSAHVSARMKAWYKEHDHPRGALGMKHTDEAKEKMLAGIKRAWNDPNHTFNSPNYRQGMSDRMLDNRRIGKLRSGYTRCRGGKRPDLNDRYFRSAWEANYARYLNWLIEKNEIASWEYECKTFIFEAIRRGTRSYTPDFKVTLNGGEHEWHEVKGWMDQPSKTRLARMERYYPEEKVIVVGQEWFRSANKTVARILSNWESGTTR